jgi:hypothetical protein
VISADVCCDEVPAARALGLALTPLDQTLHASLGLRAAA